jgi:hypothetical protein
MNSLTHTLTISDQLYPIYSGKLLPKWIRTAEEKGFDIIGRIIDRFHFALQCRHCGALTKTRLYTLMSAQPLCHACIETEWKREAEAAGLSFVNRCPDDRHYAVYRAPCGHDLRRQFELVKRAANDVTGIRCETCRHETELAEAEAEGWTLIGPDPEADPNYRHYKHVACGHTQRIARANLQTGRLSCGGCGEKWSAAPSELYVMTFTLPNSRPIVKLGYSNNPKSRLYRQLLKDADMPCAILKTVPIATGQLAIQIEKRLHKKLRNTYPNAVIAPETYAAHLKVKSEIYDAKLTATILAELDAVTKQLGATGS